MQSIASVKKDDGKNVTFHPLLKGMLFGVTTVENSLALFSNAKHRIPRKPAIPFPGMCLIEILTSASEDKHNMFLTVLSHHNSPKLETMQISINKREHIEVVVFIR